MSALTKRRNVYERLVRLEVNRGVFCAQVSNYIEDGPRRTNQHNLKIGDMGIESREVGR